MSLVSYVLPGSSSLKKAAIEVQPGIFADLSVAGDTSGQPLPQDPYQLLTNAAVTGSPVAAIRGGDYVWRVEGTFGGATATLQYLGLDGVTWIDAKDATGATAALTAAGAPGVGIGQNATVRVKLAGGAPSGMFSNLARLG